MQIKWTEMARINLVETVIKVEAEKWKSNREKWERISALLPPQFREKTWNARRQAYNVPKCETMFSDLLHAYRCKLAGNSKRMPRVLTKLMCRVLKRYEDIRNGRPFIQADECSRLRAVKASKNSSQHVRESSKETGNFDNKFETDEDIGADQDLSNAMTSVKWTETACLHLVKAVIQVEKESQHMHIRSCWNTRMGKWERVDSLLPPHLQGRTWNKKKGMYNPPKCASCFHNLREAYKAHLRQKGGKSSRENSRRLLQSKPLLSLLKKHEHLLDLTAPPHRTENSSKSESFNGVSAGAAPCNVSTEREEQSASKYSASYTLRSASRDVTESKDCQGLCKRSSRLGAYTRANQKTSLCSSESPPSDYFRGSRSMERATSMPSSRCEGSHSNLAAPLSRLDVEFSQFGKWVQDQLIPSAEKVMTSSNNSGKRRKLNFGTAAVPIGDPLHDSQSRRISVKIRASFQQLRVQLAEDLKKTCVEIAEVLLQDKH